ncbi:MAG: class I SAM-dependent methyltransferase [Candidatus Woesearchaeota archaeon]
MKNFIKKEGLGYQSIKLRDTIKTKGHDRSELIKKAFPKTLKNKSLLDVGCYLGYFCLEASKRGAKEVKGLDVDPEKIRNAKKIAEIKRRKIKFEIKDIELLEETKAYDYVLCLNLLHHLNEPIKVINKLINITKDTLILEIATLGTHDYRKLSISKRFAKEFSKKPLIYVNKGVLPTNRGGNQKYFFSEESIRRILSEHKKLFSEIKIINSDFKTRKIIIAKKEK